MKKYKRFCICALCALLCIFCSCRRENGPAGALGKTPGGLPGEVENPNGSSVYVEQLETALPTAPLAGDCNIQSDCTVTLTGTGAQVEGEGVTVKENTVTIERAGTYLLTGSLLGQLRVSTDDGEEVRLLFNGVRITANENSAVLILSAPKRVTVYTVKGSKNILEDAQTYTFGEEDVQPSACIYSKEDLNFDGEGELYVTSHCMEGICSKDDLKILGGYLSVNAGNDGIKGKDSVTVSGGEIGILAGKDGVKASNNEEEKGTVLVTGGSMVINAGDDGIDAVGKITLAAGTVSIMTGGGASANNENKGDDFGGGGWGGGGGFRPGPRFDSVDMGISALSADIGGKGVKSDSEISLVGCALTVNSYDDALHAAANITISEGTVLLCAGDDGIHCDLNVTLAGGTLTVTQSYEGVEGQYITVSGGEIHVTAFDDGFNATAGGSSGGMGGFRSGGTGQDCHLRFEGGRTVINASGDGADSNGNIYQTGGIVIVFGPTNNGNGAIDSGDGRDNGYFFSGGELLAVGSSGMMEGVIGDPAHIALRTETIAASSSIYILASDGSCVVAFTTPKTISSIVFASSKAQGGELSVYVGGNVPEFADTDNVAFFPESVPSGGKLLTTVKA